MNKNGQCPWALSDPLYTKYHDREWGVPVQNDRKLFEFLILEGAQAGLSWITILKKRENYRKAFDGFEASKMARYNKAKIKKLLTNAGIVRNRLKIESTVSNAKVFLVLQKEFKTFDRYIWQFVGHRVIRNKFKALKNIPAKTEISDQMSQDLKKRGFRFVGSSFSPLCTAPSGR